MPNRTTLYPHNPISPMLSFSISWTVPDSGRFGFTTIEDCRDLEDATTFFMDSVRGKDPAVPADAQIDTVREVN